MFESIAIGIGALLLGGALNWAYGDLLAYVTKPLGNVDQVIAFPIFTSMEIRRAEIPFLTHSGVYNAIAIRRNPEALELRLRNSSGLNVDDPFSFYLPLDETVLREMAALLISEANRLDGVGSS